MTTADVHMSDEAERERKAAKKAKKAEKKARLAAEAAANGTEAPAASPASSPSPSPSPSASPVSMDESESYTDDAAAAEAKKKKKAEKKARKAAEAAAAAAAEADSTPASAAPSTSSSSSSKSAKASASPRTPLRKNYYQQHAEIAGMSDSAVEAYRAEHKMTLTGEMYGQEAMYKPVTDFHQCGYSKQMLKCTEGFKAPTGIQAQCWPVLLMGRDAIAIAETGSGKTLGFVLPALVHILDSPPIDKSRKGRSVDNMGPIALVLAPTRELAMQSAEVAEKASQSVGLITACIYGGVEPFKQRAALANGVHMLVCTPGRLLSMIKSNDVSLKRVSFLVLDEADRMLDLGFEPDIRAIIGYCPDSQHRQTLMFSATWPESVKKLASEFIVDPLRITIGKDADEMETDTLAANKRITQTVEVMEDFKKESRLQQLLAEHTKDGGAKHKKILVFVLYKKEVDRVERTLRQRGFAAVGMSADKTQAERVQALEDFKSGKSRLLVATDVAGRGLDVRDIELVINYTFPLTIADYVHRIGRTGRGGKSGEAITFFTKNEKGLSGELINVLREANQPVPEDLMKFGTGVKRKEHAMYGAFGPKSGDDRPMKKATKVTFD